MKKLISVFAALALVGSLAAQKKKPAAKAPAAPAAPAVTAPAVSVTPPTVTGMPAAGAASGAGMGLFIEARGGFTLGNGSSATYLNGDATTATAQPYAAANTSGFGGGATVGYNFMKGLGLVASFDYRSVKSREWSVTNSTAGPVSLAGVGLAGQAAAASSGSTLKTQNTKNTIIIGLGVRPSVAVGPGELYAGAGAALVLPYDSTTSGTFTNPSAAGAQSSTITFENKTSYNMAIGAYGELGYNFNVTENIYVGLGARILVATANNKDKDKVTTYKSTSAAGNTGDVTITSTGKETVDPTNTDVTTTAGTTTTVTRKTQEAFGTDGITDITGTVTVGFRF